MTRRLLLSYISLTVLVLLSLEVPLAVIYAHSERQDLNAQAERAAGAVATLVEDNLENALPVSSPLVTTAARRYGRATGGHVIVLDKAGVAQIDTARPSSTGRSYHDQPEVRAALDGRIASGRLPSSANGAGRPFRRRSGRVRRRGERRRHPHLLHVVGGGAHPPLLAHPGRHRRHRARSSSTGRMALRPPRHATVARCRAGRGHRRCGRPGSPRARRRPARGAIAGARASTA